MRTLLALALTGTALLSGPAAAQLLPRVGGLGPVVEPVERALDPLRDSLATITSTAARLAELRTERLAELVRSHRDVLELDAAGQVARRGEVLLVGPSDAQLALAREQGFAIVAAETLDELGVAVVHLGVPAGMSLARAEQQLQRSLPGATIATDQLHFVSGRSSPGHQASGTPTPLARIAAPVGMIDGAPGPGVVVERTAGFARGAPQPSQHGSAVASLLSYAGARTILVADVYGTDPAGGGALAIARGLDWLLAQGVRVVSMSLVGPDNPLVGRAIAAAQRKGVIVVAAVGNDGPAAPPSYPASYPGVLAVTAVDGRNRALIEAGRPLHLDFAAPGADLDAADRNGKWARVRGSSYAAPLVAARVAAALDAGAANPLGTLDREAIDLGPKGPDRIYGRGLVCSSCRPGSVKNRPAMD